MYILIYQYINLFEIPFKYIKCINYLSPFARLVETFILMSSVTNRTGLVIEGSDFNM